jgi:SAM-dependent methyltransferase
MPGLDNQLTYWSTTGATKTFTHPVDFTWLGDLAPTARILDYGCGYGRVARLALHEGFTNVEGVDTSPSLIERARRDLPDLTFHTLTDPPHLPYPDASIDAVLLLAVLTCIPTDDGQQRLIAELTRVLRPGGLLYLSDLLLQTDERNLARYRQYADVYGNYGVFAVGDGAVCRHHSAERLHSLVDGFAVTTTRQITVRTMNANSVAALQLLATKQG